MGCLNKFGQGLINHHQYNNTNRKYSLKMNNCNQKKVKRKINSLETKIAILNRLADGEGSTALGKDYKLGESTIRAIQKRASRINESKNSATNESGKRISYSRNILIEKTEKALIFSIND
uniref:HTH psq-type domain-containing protein n=1 Tax=Glossina palpalis gambiensis TaxID=67801 RepID=A0A1B0BIE1_9MUSC